MTYRTLLCICHFLNRTRSSSRAHTTQWCWLTITPCYFRNFSGPFFRECLRNALTYLVSEGSPRRSRVGSRPGPEEWLECGSFADLLCRLILQVKNKMMTFEELILPTCFCSTCFAGAILRGVLFFINAGRLRSDNFFFSIIVKYLTVFRGFLGYIDCSLLYVPSCLFRSSSFRYN